ncbi:MAG: glycosyltransferase, partial [Clostridia bacterium]|nr:glycosyltransferase [Clostridia bacterium]
LVVTRADTVHICYCHTPMRYAWDFYHEYLNGPDVGKLKGNLIPWLMNYLRMWDRLSADRVDYFIANSHNVARRVMKHYRRESAVIYPPVEASYFTPVDEDEDFFLVVSRLVPYKRVDLAIQVCNQLGLPLRVIGVGPEYERLKALAGPTVQMMGRLSGEEIKWHYARCRAFLFPGEEDFGITPLEAQASGRPVIAFAKGGALETVVANETGLFFEEQTVDSLVSAMRRYNEMVFHKKVIRQHAENFDVSKFKERFMAFVKEKYK